MPNDAEKTEITLTLLPHCGNILTTFVEVRGLIETLLGTCMKDETESVSPPDAIGKLEACICEIDKQVSFVCRSLEILSNRIGE